MLLVSILRAPLARSRIQNLFATALPWPFDYSPPLAQGKALERPGLRESELSALLWKVPAATLWEEEEEGCRKPWLKTLQGSAFSGTWLPRPSNSHTPLEDSSVNDRSELPEVGGWPLLPLLAF